MMSGDALVELAGFELENLKPCNQCGTAVHLVYPNRNIIGALRLELHTMQVPPEMHNSTEMHNYRVPSINVHVFLSQQDPVYVIEIVIILCENSIA